MKEFDHKLITQRRELQHLTQEDLAKKTGLDITTISRIELGKVKPRAATLLKIADALKIGPENFYIPPSTGFTIREESPGYGSTYDSEESPPPYQKLELDVPYKLYEMLQSNAKMSFRTTELEAVRLLTDALYPVSSYCDKLNEIQSSLGFLSDLYATYQVVRDDSGHMQINHMIADKIENLKEQLKDITAVIEATQEQRMRTLKAD